MAAGAPNLDQSWGVRVPREWSGDIVAGQAGWYNAPGEAGLLRYWDGSVWTGHRQPIPAPQPPVPVVEPTPVVESVPSEPDWSMDQFEKQFHQPATPASDFSDPFGVTPGAFPTAPATSAIPVMPAADWTQPSPATSFGSPLPQAPVLEAQPLQESPLAFSPPPLAADHPGSLAAAPAPFAMPAAETPVEPVSLANAPAPAPEAPMAAPAFAMPATGNATFDRFVHVAEEFAESSQTRGVAEELGGAALAADGIVGFGRKRKSILAAVKGMGTGIVFIAIGLGLMFFAGQSSTPAAGQIKTVGIITNLNTSGGACDPTARFAGQGGSYQANAGISVSPCPFQLGEAVDVVYTASDPASTGHIAVPNAISQYFFLIPILGGIVFIASLITFIVRAGSIVGGIALIRDGNKRRRRSTATAPTQAQ